MTETNCQGWTDGQTNGQCENKRGWQTLQILIRLALMKVYNVLIGLKKLNQVSIWQILYNSDQDHSEFKGHSY